MRTVPSAGMTRLLVPAALTLALLAALLWPVAGDPAGQALGDADSARLAFASLWRGLEQLLDVGPFVDASATGWPGTDVGVREDPLSVLAAYPGFLAFGGELRGVVAGWNGLQALLLTVGAVGAVVLARELDEDERGRVTNGANDALVIAAFCGSALALRLPVLGHTGLWAAMFLPLGLGLLHKTLRTNRWEHAASSGLALAAVCLGGPRTALFAAFVVLPAAWAWTRRWHDDVAKTSVALGVGLLGLAPGVMGWVDHGVEVSASAAEVWPVLAALRAEDGLQGLEPVVYPGWAAVALGLFGTRRGLGWAGLALLLTVLGLGATIVLPGGEMPGPGLALGALGVEGLNHLGLFAALAAGLAAHAGWRRLTSLRPWVRYLWPLPLGLLLADTGTWPAVWTPAPTWDPTPPAELRDAVASAPAGALLHVPIGDDDVLLWQPSHGRPISAIPGGDALGEELEILQPQGQPTPARIEAVRQEAVRLDGMGAGAIVLDGQAPELEALLVAALGAGERYGRFTVWPL